MSSEIITRTLYRSLLRTIKPFASSDNGPILCSLLYRNGLDDFMAQFQFSKFAKEQQFKLEQKQKHQLSSVYQHSSEEKSKEDKVMEESEKSTHLSKEEARDLSKTYHELQKLHHQNQKDHEEMLKYLNDNNTTSQDFVHFVEFLATDTHQNKGDNNIETSSDSASVHHLSSLQMKQYHQQQPHILLYKHLLRQLFYNERDNVVKHMNFPSQTIRKKSTDVDSDSDEWKCTMGQRMKQIIQREFRTNTLYYSGTLIHTSSKLKRETGFLVLRELQKKLSWAESMGMQHLFGRQHQQQQTVCDDDYDEHNRTTTSKTSESMQDNKSLSFNITDNEATNIYTLPCYPPSSYLQPGAFLVAHPMMDGIFSRAIICILQHTERKTRIKNKRAQEGKGKDSSFEIDKDDDHDNVSEKKDDLEGDETTENIENIDGGTYGLIVNLPIKVGVPNSDSTVRRRHRTLREVIRHDLLPKGVKDAFGDCPVQHGGPVNLSIQMLRITSQDDEEVLNIGGTILSSVTHEAHDLNGEVASTAIHTDKVVYFGGDIIKAAQAVIDGDLRKDDFTFFIGASCWETHQLQSEIARGYWMPFSGPSTIAIYGQCAGNQNGQANLWQTIMNSLGDKEGKIACLMLNSIDNSVNGAACDEF